MSNLKLSDIQKNTDIKLTWDNIEKHNVLSRAKIDIANHPAQKKVIVGAKGTGKSIIPIIKSLVELENDPYSNIFGFRKYKDQSIKAMSKLFYSGYSLLNLMNFKFDYEYELKVQYGGMYRMKDKRNNLKNQAFQFGSLEDVSGSTDGGGPSNGGFYKIITVDEPVVEKDAGHPDKIPSESQFRKDESIMIDNIERFNDNFARVMGRDEITTEIYYTMNNWGNHPLTVLMDKIIPEEEFLNFVFNNDFANLFGNQEAVLEWFDNKDNVKWIMEHNTMSRYKKDIDTLFTRMTKFANPNNWSEKKQKVILTGIKQALITADINMLTILIGMKAVPEIEKEMLVYNVNDYNETTQEELLEDGWRLYKRVYGLDIDETRVFTLAPVSQWRKLVKDNPFDQGKWTSRVLIEEVMDLPAWGSGLVGENYGIYAAMVRKALDKHHNKYIKPERPSLISVDWNGKWLGNELRKMKIPYVGNNFKHFDKTGEWDLKTRQSMMTGGYENKSLWTHRKNKAFINDMNVAVKQDVSKPERKTSGATNYLDRIDAIEQGIIPFAQVVWNKNKRR